MNTIPPIQAIRPVMPAFGQMKIQMTREVGINNKFGVDDENGFRAKGPGQRFNRLA
jgi:hypothetical protein